MKLPVNSDTKCICFILFIVINLSFCTNRFGETKTTTKLDLFTYYEGPYSLRTKLQQFFRKIHENLCSDKTT